MRYRRALALLLSVAPLSTLALAADRPKPGRVRMATAGLCDRAAVRACQDEAKLTVQLCRPWRGERACAAYALSDLRRCWAGTGCF